VAIREVHNVICGAQQSAHKMNWLLWRAGFFLPTMMGDCIKYQRGCEACQRFGNIQLAPTSVMNSIVKPWPFRGWGLHFMGEIHPRSSKRHRFILVATDHQVDRASPIEEQDTSGGNKFCVGTHYLSVWSPSNSNNRSRASVHVTPI
jgi:hypothetical protein